MSKHGHDINHHRYESASARHTMDAAASIVRGMVPSSGASVIALSGDLGAGKTQFAKGVAHELGITRTVTSPTFLIMRSYETKQGPWKQLFHLDCYRVDNPEELRALGWDDIVRNPDNIVLIEWAQRISALLPPDTLWIDMEVLSPTQRGITVRSYE